MLYTFNLHKCFHVKFVNKYKKNRWAIKAEIGSLRNNKKKMIEIKTTVTEMKNAFDSLSSKLKTAMEKISEHVDMSIEISKTERQREKR